MDISKALKALNHKCKYCGKLTNGYVCSKACHVALLRLYKRLPVDLRPVLPPRIKRAQLLPATLHERDQVLESLGER